MRQRAMGAGGDDRIKGHALRTPGAHAGGQRNGELTLGAPGQPGGE